jgi:hypothetical protein
VGDCWRITLVAKLVALRKHATPKAIFPALFNKKMLQRTLQEVWRVIEDDCAQCRSSLMVL